MHYAAVKNWFQRIENAFQVLFVSVKIEADKLISAEINTSLNRIPS